MVKWDDKTKSFFKLFIAANQKDWDRWISMFLLASSKHETTELTPAEFYFA